MDNLKPVRWLLGTRHVGEGTEKEPIDGIERSRQKDYILARW